jgi:OOP family OmpA-OmpF porin
MIIVSDGEEMSITPLVSAERLKTMFGDRICIYTIQIGNDSAGRMLLEKIAQAGGCGFNSQGERLLSSGDVADFVKRVLLTKKPVETAIPVQPAVPALKPVEAVKERTVIKEPSSTVKASTPEAKDVLIPIVEPLRITINIQFDTGKADIKPKYYDEIKRIADFMVKYPTSSMVIEGHTDNVGKKVYNQKLSKRRSESVRKYLIDKFRIKRTRIRAIGYGMERPIASNKTADGRKMNRRIIAVIETTIIRK